jgi:hypothetical protein
VRAGRTPPAPAPAPAPRPRPRPPRARTRTAPRPRPSRPRARPRPRPAPDPAGGGRSPTTVGREAVPADRPAVGPVTRGGSGPRGPSPPVPGSDRADVGYPLVKDMSSCTEVGTESAPFPSSSVLTGPTPFATQVTSLKETGTLSTFSLNVSSMAWAW